MAKDKKIALTITANTRQLRTDMRKAGREVQTFERQVMGLGAKMRQVKMRMQSTGIFGRGGGALRTAAGFAGVFGFTQMIEGAKAGNAALTDIAITGNLTNKELANLKKTMYDISDSTGKSTDELGRFVATVTTMTGDAKGAQKALSGIADVMVATGASGEALAGTYVKLTTSMGLMPKQAREAFNVLRSQEKLGSVTMANVAANFGKIVGAAGVYGQEGKGIKGVRTLGGLYQIAQRGFAVGQEGEAATSAASFLRFMGQRAKRIKKTFGVDVFDKEGKARDLPTVMEELGKAFNTNKEAFRTKGALIFGRSGIRTAQQLQLAMAGGADSTQGSFASYNAMVRKAGGTDVIGSDKKRRLASASAQFDLQLNLLKNATKKHISPLFKELAAGMKKWGPDLVRTLKFLLENSAGLMKLWLGHNGITFFKRLMAPVEAAGGGSAAAMQTMRTAAGGGGGSVMLPGGQMIPAGRPGGMYVRGGAGQWHKAGAIGPQWTSAGRSGGMVESTGWGTVGGVNVGPSTWRSRMRNRMGGYATRALGGAIQYGGTATRYAGMGAGAAGLMGMWGKGSETGALGKWGNNLGMMAMMSGNPIAMALGGAALMANSLTSKYTPQKTGVMAGSSKQKGAYTAQLFNSSFSNLSAVVKNAQNKGKMPFEQLRTMDTSEADRLFGLVGGTLEGGGKWSLGGDVGRLRDEYGKGGLTSLQNRFAGQAAVRRKAAIASLLKSKEKPGGEGGTYTEEQIRSRDHLYSKLMDFAAQLGMVLKDMPKRINVTAKVQGGSNPGGRVEGNSGYGGTGETPEYRPEDAR